MYKNSTPMIKEIAIMVSNTGYSFKALSFTTFNLNATINKNGATTVSYTHLDVYKRQKLSQMIANQACDYSEKYKNDTKP